MKKIFLAFSIAIGFLIGTLALAQTPVLGGKCTPTVNPCGPYQKLLQETCRVTRDLNIQCPIENPNCNLICSCKCSRPKSFECSPASNPCEGGKTPIRCYMTQDCSITPCIEYCVCDCPGQPAKR